MTDAWESSTSRSHEIQKARKIHFKEGLALTSTMNYDDGERWRSLSSILYSYPLVAI